VGVAVRKENATPWHEVEQDFLESDYQDVRERQMKEVEEEDDLMSKIPVRYTKSPLFYLLLFLTTCRNLRAQLYKESYEFVHHQRIHCLMQGAWLMNAIPILV
jgi:engulfment/cell motility protein 1